MKPIGKYIVTKAVKATATDLPQTGPPPVEKLLQLTATDKSKMLYQEALIQETGTEVEFLKPGMRILYNRSAGHEAYLNGECIRILREGDCVAVLEEGEVLE